MTNESDKRIKLSTEPYKGVRDFYPADMAVQNYIFGKMRKTVESFGYVEYSASILEPTELYEAKSGEELVKEQTYSFKDRGGRSVTLRPEMTPSVARMVAQKRRELIFPIRWYSIPNAFRYERPQRGRLREHWQLNADFFGVAGIEADTEIITLAYQILKDLGAKDSDFEIKINYAGLLSSYLADKFNLKETNANALVKIVDRFGKIPEDNFIKRTEKIINAEQARELINIIKSKNASYVKNLDVCKQVREELKKNGIFVTIDPFLTRGFDYYTGIIFEVYDTNPKNKRSIFGGGRYDNLLEIFGTEKIPAVGFGMGDVPIRNFLEVRNLIPEYVSTTDLMLCTLAKENIAYAQKLASKLRKEGLNVGVDLSNKKIGGQIKTADKQGVPFVICIGDEEEKSGKFKLKELKTGKEKEVNEEKITNVINAKIEN